MATALSSPAAARRRTPLAVWHLLSLDAPAVAALWTVLFLRIHRLPVPAAVPLALGLAVWMFYAADRLADAAVPAGQLEERHRFHALHAPAFMGLMIGALPCLGLLIYVLPAVVREGWLLLAVPLGAYVAAVHGFRLPRFPKEAAVGVFFGAATMLPAAVAAHAPLGMEAAGAACFGLVCWFNCVAIARWEEPDNVAPSTRLAARHLPGTGLAILFACGALGIFGSAWTACACAGSVLLLLLLDRARTGSPYTSGVHLRAMADAALLTPMLLLPVLERLR